jgi:hypothetical protein
MGAGFLIVQWCSTFSSLEIVMAVEITTLDRFARELADLLH